MVTELKKIGLFWFTNDLRLHDNPALFRASQSVDELLCVFVIDQPDRAPYGYGLKNLGAHRERFLNESLNTLHRSLSSLNQKLIIVHGEAEVCLNSLIGQYKVNSVYRSCNAGWYEKITWANLQTKQIDTKFVEIDTHTLFDQDSLPFELTDLPTTFTKFRKLVEPIRSPAAMSEISVLPKPPQKIHTTKASDSSASNSLFKGGEKYALEHVTQYFSGDLPAHYKEVRNAIDGWNNSCKFSPWLATGSLSVRELVRHLRLYEKKVVANNSTYWIYFELLWRDYFQWYAHKFGKQLYKFAGIKNTPPLTSYYAERFKKWVAGHTPYPLVNACMNELAATGYLSNRGRQIVASCLVNELAVDWRYGAAYFEYILIDYDVASNWGNWQYIAGVGADAREKRHFNLEKQTQMFDAKGIYQDKWGTNIETQPLDSVDAADWPI